MPQAPSVSFVLATHQRRAIVRQTLQHLAECGLERGDFEIWVVDNSRCGGSAAEAAAQWPAVRSICSGRNLGSCAKALAIPRTRGRYLVLLDDDSHPLPGSIERMIQHFERDRRLGAAGFMVHLPDGGRECAALPNVFVGCGVGLRREALQAAGGLDLSYFMQAEEYDLAFRLARAGYTVRCFGDLQVMHDKSAAGRQPRRTLFYDLRNNLTLAAQYLPRPWHREFLRDWSRRYVMLGAAAGVRIAGTARISGLLRGYLRRYGRFGRLPFEVFDQLFGVTVIREQMDRLRAAGQSKVLLAGLGKNIFPYYIAARQAGLAVPAILDDRFSRIADRYRGVPLAGCGEMAAHPADAIVISDSAPVHAERLETQLRSLTALPIYRPHGRWEFEVASPVEPIPSSRDSA